MRRLVVPKFAERIRKPRVGIAMRITFSDAVESLYVRAHFLGSERAV